MKKLRSGDRVSFIQNGRRLRGVVCDHIPVKARGVEYEVPVIRLQRRSATRPLMEQISTPRVRWIPRSQLRKLPEQNPQ